MPSLAPSTGRREQFLNSVRRQLSTEQLRGCLELPVKMSRPNGAGRTRCSFGSGGSLMVLGGGIPIGRYTQPTV